MYNPHWRRTKSMRGSKPPSKHQKKDPSIPVLPNNYLSSSRTRLLLFGSQPERRRLDRDLKARMFRPEMRSHLLRPKTQHPRLPSCRSFCTLGIKHDKTIGFAVETIKTMVFAISETLWPLCTRTYLDKACKTI